jgi:prepilin peptidase CpaA
LAAAATDVRTRKIPNAIPAAVALFGLTLHAFGGWRDFGLSAGVGIAVLLAGMIPFSLGLLGGGDVKLLAACACVLGLPYVLPLLVYTSLLGGVLALVVATFTGELRTILTRVGGRIAPTLVPGATATPPTRTRLPYAVAIAGGVTWILLGETLLPALKVIK